MFLQRVNLLLNTQLCTLVLQAIPDHFFCISVCDIKMILAYYWELEFLMRVIRRQLSVFDWLPVVVSTANGYSDDPDFLHRAETPQLRELCEGEIEHTHTRTQMKHSLLSTQPSMCPCWIAACPKDGRDISSVAGRKLLTESWSGVKKMKPVIMNWNAV